MKNDEFAPAAGAELQSDQAFAALIAALRAGRLRSSEFIAMPALAAMLGFALAPMREAVKRAESQALLTILPKRGIIIMDAGPAITRACMDMRATLDKEGARRLLAGPAGGLDRAVLSRLRVAHQALLDDARRQPGADLSRQALATDLSLHDFMADGLGNPLLRQAYEANRNRITVIQNARVFLADRVASAMEEHLAIIGALEEGDAPRAVAEVERHLEQTLRWWGIMG